MKSQSIIAIGLFAILSSAVITTNAQSFNEPAIKILPSTEKGVLKVLYAYGHDQSNQHITVKFFNSEGVIKSDDIRQESFKNGFLKKYDIRRLASGSASFWVEVKSANVTAVYKVSESKDGSTLEALLENSTINHEMVAANN